MPSTDIPFLRIAAQCDSRIESDALHETPSFDPLSWVQERVEAWSQRGASGSLYVFLSHPPSAAVAAALRWTAAGRLSPCVVAEGAALPTTASLELLRDAAIRALYLSLHGAGAEAHERCTRAPGSWKHALLLLTKGPRILERIRMDAHLSLRRDTVAAVPGVLRVLRKVGNSELLLWDAGCWGPDEPAALDASEALRGLDLAVNSAQQLGVRIRAVGFQRTRGLTVAKATTPRLASAAMIELLRDGISLPSTTAGLFASDGTRAPLLEAAPSGVSVSQLAFEMAARRRPFLDLPPCLGGPPVASTPTRTGTKLPTCEPCAVDATCAGIPEPMRRASGIEEVSRPPVHWAPVLPNPRVLVLCTVVSDRIYGATFFRLARDLAGMGARVDVVSPWQVHTSIAADFAGVQPPGVPESGSEVDRFIASGPLDEYDLIVAPYIETARRIWESGRVAGHARLVATDFHMLGGMYEWARDVCPPGRRPEEGGWWPSDRIVLNSAFPGYSPLYTRYGVPMRQVAWQPFAVDLDAFPSACEVSESTYIVSGGNHRRDLPTFLAAAARLSAAVHAIELFAQEQGLEVPAKVRFRGAVPTFAFRDSVARSRFMVVPLLEDPINAAGITAVVTALVLGRPVVATESAATRDYVQDGVSGLLVPANDAAAMAAAIERLDTDPDLLRHLAEGARRTRERLSTRAWAEALLFGSRMYEPHHWLWTR